MLYCGSDGQNMKNQPIEIGDALPEFSVKDQNGNPVSNSTLQGRSVVLFFYPKDNSLICTKQACAFRDSYEAFLEYGCEVIGISSDDDKSHIYFSDKLRLPYRLISDKNNLLRDLFGVSSNLLGIIPGRVTYIADKNGIVRFKFNSQLSGSKHVKEALNYLAQHH